MHVRALLLWLTDALLEIGVRKPQALATTVAYPLIAGTRQAVPADAILLLDIVRNLGADGATPGRPVKLTDREELDSMAPDWHAMRAASAVKHFTYDPRTPKQFFVYPPAMDGTKVELTYAKAAAPVTSEDDDLPIDVEYRSALVSFILYRALSRESEDASGQLAAAHYSAFTGALGQDQQAAQAAQTAGV